MVKKLKKKKIKELNKCIKIIFQSTEREAKAKAKASQRYFIWDDDFYSNNPKLY